MASPRVPFKTYRIIDLALNVTRESLLKCLGLESIGHRIFVSFSHLTGIESNCQTVTLTIPEDHRYEFSPESFVSIEGRSYLLDQDFEGFTPLCSIPRLENFIEYEFSLLMQETVADFWYTVSLQLRA